MFRKSLWDNLWDRGLSIHITEFKFLLTYYLLLSNMIFNSWIYLCVSWFCAHPKNEYNDSYCLTQSYSERIQWINMYKTFEQCISASKISVSVECIRVFFTLTKISEKNFLRTKNNLAHIFGVSKTKIRELHWFRQLVEVQYSDTLGIEEQSLAELWNRAAKGEHSLYNSSFQENHLVRACF